MRTLLMIVLLTAFATQANSISLRPPCDTVTTKQKTKQTDKKKSKRSADADVRIQPNFILLTY